MGHAVELARRVGWFVATLMGDNRYQRYLDYRRRAHPGEPVLSEREFWRHYYAGDPGPRCC